MRLLLVAVAPAVASLLYNLVAYAGRARFIRRLSICDAPEPLARNEAAHAWVAEWWATALALTSVLIGLLPLRQLDRRSEERIVVLVHGWGLNRGCLWWLARRLQQAGWGPIYFLDYRSIGFDVETGAIKLRELIEQKVPAGRSPITLIGHSLGGLVIRYYLRRYPAPRVRRVITLGTPHGGTEWARRRGRDHPLAPGSSLLRDLAAGDRVAQQFDTISIYSTFDALVLPAESGFYPGASNIQLNRVGHNALLFSTKVWELIRENLSVPPR